MDTYTMDYEAFGSTCVAIANAAFEFEDVPVRADGFGINVWDHVPYVKLVDARDGKEDGIAHFCDYVDDEGDSVVVLVPEGSDNWSESIMLGTFCEDDVEYLDALGEFVKSHPFTW